MADEQKPTYEELELLAKMAWGIAIGPGPEDGDPRAWLLAGREAIAEVCGSLAVIHGSELITAWLRSFSARDRHIAIVARAREIGA
jgi:hypothetical protein